MSGEASGDQLWDVTRPTRKEHVDGAWYEHQCLHCAFYHPLEGPRGADWGVCFNSASVYAGMLKFEHQGCDQHVQEDPE